MRTSVQQLWFHQNDLTKQVEEIWKSLELIQRNSYQYNVKIFGLLKWKQVSQPLTQLHYALASLKLPELKFQFKISILHIAFPLQHHFWSETCSVQVYTKDFQREGDAWTAEIRLQGYSFFNWFYQPILL